jgi:predicted nucleotidyltransferase
MEETYKRILLILFKDSSRYNANTISKQINLTRIGAYKALKLLEKQGLLKSERLGKAIFYELNLKDTYVQKNLELLLMEEARNKARWRDEFSLLYPQSELVIIFGSILRSEEKAKDIDLLIIPKNNSKVNQIIDQKNQILIKKIHSLKQTENDLINNIKKEDKVILSALKEGIVLHGAEKMVEIKCHI